MAAVDRAVAVAFDQERHEAEREEAWVLIEEAKADPYFFSFALEKSLEVPLCAESRTLLFFYLKSVEELLERDSETHDKSQREALWRYLEFSTKERLPRLAADEMLLTCFALVYVKAMQRDYPSHWPSALSNLVKSATEGDAGLTTALCCFRTMVEEWGPECSDDRMQRLLRTDIARGILPVLVVSQRHPSAAIAFPALRMLSSLFDLFPQYRLQDFLPEVAKLKERDLSTYVQCVELLLSSRRCQQDPVAFATLLDLIPFIVDERQLATDARVTELISTLGMLLLRRGEVVLAICLFDVALAGLKSSDVSASLQLTEFLQMLWNEQKRGEHSSKLDALKLGKLYFAVLTRLRTVTHTEFMHTVEDELFDDLLAILRDLIANPLLAESIFTVLHQSQWEELALALSGLLRVRDSLLSSHCVFMLLALHQANSSFPLRETAEALCAQISPADIDEETEGYVLTLFREEIAQLPSSFTAWLISRVWTWQTLGRERVEFVTAYLKLRVEDPQTSSLAETLFAFVSRVTVDIDASLAQLCCAAVSAVKDALSAAIHELLRTLFARCSSESLCVLMQIFTHVTLTLETNLISALPYEIVSDLLCGIITSVAPPDVLPDEEQRHVSEIRLEWVRLLLALSSKSMDLLGFLDPEAVLAYVSSIICSAYELRCTTKLALQLACALIAMLISADDHMSAKQSVPEWTYKVTRWLFSHLSWDSRDVLKEVVELHKTAWRLCSSSDCLDAFRAAAQVLIPAEELQEYESLLETPRDDSGPDADASRGALLEYFVFLVKERVL